MENYTAGEIIKVMRELAEECESVREGMVCYDSVNQSMKRDMENMLLVCMNSNLFRELPMKTRLKIFCTVSPNS